MNIIYTLDPTMHTLRQHSNGIERDSQLYVCIYIYMYIYTYIYVYIYI